MKMTKILAFAVSLLVGITLTACTANYENINQDKYGVTDDEMERDGYGLTSALLAMQNNVVPTKTLTCQYTDCLLGGPWGGYLSDANASWSNTLSTYNASDHWMQWFFTAIIPEIYPAMTRLRRITEDLIPLSIADILKVAAMHRITDAYGPIPYSKIGADGKLQVAYDSQEMIYETMISELNGAIKNLSDLREGSISKNADIVYAGDLVKWIRFANSLKLRLAMRLSYVAPDKAKMWAEEAIGHEIGVIRNNAENAQLRQFGSDGNPIYKASRFNAGDSRVNANITTYMNGYNDPRRSAYFCKSDFSNMPYVGLRSGIDIPTSSVRYSQNNLTEASPLQWLNAAEVAFLCAEYELRWGESDKVRDYYEQGIRLSFEQWGIGGAEDYCADNEHVPGNYKDPEDTNSYSAQLTDCTIKWNDDVEFEKKLERIIIQKWIANWTLGNEAWADRRRTGYPVLMPVVENGSGGILANDAIPRRCPYPVAEYSTNGANVADALKELGGDDNIATRVWWDCKK